MLTSIESKTSAILLNIRNQRILKDYSQEYVALKLGISQNAYSKIELGHSAISVQRLILIAEILEVDVLELIKT